METSIPTLVQELKEKAPALGAWTYIALWGFAEMTKRMREHPETPRFSEIKFPHSDVPLFTEDQAHNLEKVWNESPLFQMLHTQKGQVGGSSESGIFETIDTHAEFLLSGGYQVQSGGNLNKAKEAASKVGNAIGKAFGSVNPELFSPDAHVHSMWDTLDKADAEITNFSKQYGLTAIESVVPDPKYIIPLGPFPLPIIVPVKTILPVINMLLEIVRVMGHKIPLIGTHIQTPISILLAFLDLARGNFYHSIFSFIGVFGRSPMIVGITLKVLRDAFLLISPNLRGELRSVLYKSSKSFIVGFFFWLFTTVSPEIIRRPIVKLLDKVRALIESYNEKAADLSEKATLALKGVGRVEIPQMPSDKIPSFGDLYVIQEYIQLPQVYCHPEVDAIIQDMRSIPPLALFFDLLNIPLKSSPEWQQVCAEVESTPLAEFIKPKIELTPQPIV